VVAGAAAVELTIAARLDVCPRSGERPLFAIWTLRRGAAIALHHATWTLRDQDGAQTAEALRLKAFSGF